MLLWFENLFALLALVRIEVTLNLRKSPFSADSKELLVISIAWSLAELFDGFRGSPISMSITFAEVSIRIGDDFAP